MRKQYINFFLLLLSAIPYVTFAQEASPFIYTGNTVRYNKSTIGSSSKTLAGAVRLCTEKIKLLKENNITAIRFYQSSREVEQVKIFVTRSLENGIFDYQQQVASVTDGWNEVELARPFPIDGAELFIGCEIKAGQPLIGTNANWENGLNGWCRQDGTWDHASGDRAMCITGIVRGDKLPRHNIRLVSTDLPLHTYEQTGQPFNLKVYLFNEAVETIRNATVQLSINGNEPVVKTVSGLDIPYLSSDTIEIEGLSIPQEGEFPCVLTVTRLNGQDDLDMSNNSSSGEFFSRLEFVRRKVLLENFSTENCANCPAGHQYIEERVGDNPAVIMVTHHCGFGTDDFTIDESKEYTCFYKTQFAPAYMLDRTNLGPQGAGDQYGNSYTPMVEINYNNFAELTGYALKVPAFATIGLEAEYDENTRRLTVSAKGQSILPLPGSDSRLNIFITEDSVQAIRQNGATEPYLHNQTMRAVLTGTWGEAVELEQGFTRRYETVLPEEWEAKNINVVAFLSNYDDQDVNNRFIYNTEARQLFSRSGIQEQAADKEIKVYSVNGTLKINGEYKSVRVYDLAGKRVGMYSLKEGIYLLEFETLNSKITTLKTVIHN